MRSTDEAISAYYKSSNINKEFKIATVAFFVLKNKRVF
jgi:hypothetical protein